MDEWYSVSLGDGMMAPLPSAKIQQLFSKLYPAESYPAGAAVFTRFESGDLHCKVIAYFSPATVALANAFDATLCAKPECNELSLIAGDEEVWSIWFPETQAAPSGFSNPS